MTPRPWLIKLAYVAFTGLALLFWLYMTFPAEAVGQRLSHEITKATAGKYNVVFGDVSLHRLTGISAEDVRIRASASDDSGEDLEFVVDEFWARVELLPLFLFRVAVSAGLGIGEGTVDIDVASGADEGGYTVALDIDAVDLMSPPILPKLASMPLGGKLAGKAEGVWNPELRKSQGSASLTIEAANAGPADIQGFSVPPVELGQLDVAFDLRGGRLQLASFQQKGGDLDARISATSTLRPAFKASSLDACFEIKPTETFLNANPKFKTVMELAQMKFKKDGEGFLHVSLGGTFAKPRQRRALCKGKKGKR